MPLITKALVRTLYDVQHERIQTGNRICAEIKNRLGQDPGKSEKELEKEAKDYLDRARAEFKRITDAFVLNQAHKYLKVEYGDYEIITDAGMLVFVELYVEQLTHENHMAKVIAKLVAQHPLWDAFLEGVRGCGPLMSAVILSEFDIHKAERISQFWKYAGLDVAEDGRGRSKRKEHLVEQEYTDKNGKAQTKMGVSYNPFLKTKLIGVLGGSFLKDVDWAPCDKPSYERTPEHRRKMKRIKGKGPLVPHVIVREGKYRIIYNEYKHRLEHHAKYGIQNDEKKKAEAKKQNKTYAPVLHRHRMALRYAVKMFLQELWLAWRKLEGLPITAPYSEAVLGHKHHVGAA